MADQRGQRVKCEVCGRNYPWKAQYAGRRVRCQCGGVIQMPAREAGAPAPGVTAAAATPRAKTAGAVKATGAVRRDSGGDADKASGGSGLAALLAEASVAPSAAASARPAARVVAGNVCPSCHKPVKPGAILCVQCGYNFKDGKRVQARSATPAPGAAAGLTPGVGRFPGLGAGMGSRKASGGSPRGALLDVWLPRGLVTVLFGIPVGALAGAAPFVLPVPIFIMFMILVMLFALIYVVMPISVFGARLGAKIWKVELDEPAAVKLFAAFICAPLVGWLTAGAVVWVLGALFGRSFPLLALIFALGVGLMAALATAVALVWLFFHVKWGEAFTICGLGGVFYILGNLLSSVVIGVVVWGLFYGYVSMFGPPQFIREEAQKAADRMHSGAKLSKVGGAIHRYCLQHRGQMSPDLATVKSSMGLSDEDVTSPFGGQYTCIRVDLDKEGSSPAVILGYDPGELGGGEGTNILLADYHVEWLRKDAAERAIAAGRIETKGK